MTRLGTLESREGKKLQHIRLECFSKYKAWAKLSYINKINILSPHLLPKQCDGLHKEMFNHSIILFLLAFTCLFSHFVFLLCVC